MMRTVWGVMAVILGLGLVTLQARSEPPTLVQILSQPLKIERTSPLTELPLSLRNGKLYLDAKVNDFEAEFIFDTGSPTILDQSIADQLELDIIGENTGRDANGTPVTMKIARVPILTLGTLKFKDVPVLVHDYSTVPLGTCFLPHGVLGSDLLPGSVWRINLSDAVIQIAAQIEDMPALAPSSSAPLFVFGYPFAPLIEYSIGRFSDKALFDTGNAARLALFAEIETDRQVRKQIDKGSVRTGSGRHGTSAGGIGRFAPLKQYDLKSVRLGHVELGRTPTQSRPVPPTLLGADLLNTHILTLDYPNQRFLMSPRDAATEPGIEAGYALMVNQGYVEVSQLYEGSNAQAVGLKLGDRVVAIEGQPLSLATEAARCETSLWLANEFKPAAVTVLTVQRADERLDIVLE